MDTYVFIIAAGTVFGTLFSGFINGIRRNVGKLKVETHRWVSVKTGKVVGTPTVSEMHNLKTRGVHRTKMDWSTASIFRSTIATVVLAIIIAAILLANGNSFLKIGIGVVAVFLATIIRLIYREKAWQEILYWANIVLLIILVIRTSVITQNNLPQNTPDYLMIGTTILFYSTDFLTMIFSTISDRLKRKKSIRRSVTGVNKFANSCLAIFQQLSQASIKQEFVKNFKVDLLNSALFLQDGMKGDPGCFKNIEKLVDKGILDTTIKTNGVLTSMIPSILLDMSKTDCYLLYGNIGGLRDLTRLIYSLYRRGARLGSIKSDKRITEKSLSLY